MQKKNITSNTCGKESLADEIRALGVFDSELDEMLSCITHLASVICEVPWAFIAFCDANRTWVRSSYGMRPEWFADELKICRQALKSSTLFEREGLYGSAQYGTDFSESSDARVDFFAGQRLVSSRKVAVGVLAVADSQARLLKRSQKEALMILSQQVMALLESRRREFESQAMNRAAGLEKMVVKPSDSIKAGSEYFSSMSHDIRTPMHAIIGFTDVLSQTPLDDSQREYVESVRSAGEDLLGVINDILDVSRLHTEGLSIESIPFSIGNVVKGVVSTLKEKAEAKGLSLTWHLDESIPETVRGDSTRLSQILINLVGSTIKSTLHGGVSLEVKVESVAPEKVTFGFSVKDTSKALGQQRAEILFKHLSPGQTEIYRHLGVAALGTDISKLLIEMQGGKIAFSSEAGKGSDFSFVIAYKPCVSNAEVPVGGMPIDTADYGKARILLVDDNLLNQFLMKKVITSFGFEIEVADNGQAGVELAKSKPFDLILMDIQMPLMDGYQATEILRKEVGIRIPIIALTAHAMEDEKEKCLRSGMDEYLSKPFKQEDLLRKISYFLKPAPYAVTEISAPELDRVETSSQIDMSYLKSLSDGNSQFENELLTMTIAQVGSEADTLAAAFAKGDSGAVRTIAHGLKSSVSLYGVPDLVPLLSNIERLAAQGTLDSEAKRDVLYVVTRIRNSKATVEQWLADTER